MGSSFRGWESARLSLHEMAGYGSAPSGVAHRSGLKVCDLSIDALLPYGSSPNDVIRMCNTSRDYAERCEAEYTERWASGGYPISVYQRKVSLFELSDYGLQYSVGNLMTALERDVGGYDLGGRMSSRAMVLWFEPVIGSTYHLRGIPFCVCITMFVADDNASPRFNHAVKVTEAIDSKLGSLGTMDLIDLWLVNVMLGSMKRIYSRTYPLRRAYAASSLVIQGHKCGYMV